MKRILFIGLVLAVCSASLFMVVESGDYYSTFYQNDYQGYWAAFLIELFLAICAMLHFTRRRFLNISVKAVMVPLFLVVVGGASLKVVSPLLNKLARTEKQSQLLDFLLLENRQNTKNLALLQGQRVNTAVSIQHQRKISSKIRDELKKESAFPWMIWLIIGFSTFLRFAVQLANLVFAHCLGVIWRESKKPKTGMTKQTGKRTRRKQAE